MPNRERAAGGIVFRSEPFPSFLMILDAYGRWTFPKGHVEPGETPEEAAVREIEEETGVRARVITEIGRIGYVYEHPSRGAVSKTVIFYLLHLEAGCLQPQPGEIAEAAWVYPEEAAGRAGYEGLGDLADEARRVLREHPAGRNANW